MANQPLSRRERYREETRTEIKEIALRQLAQAGPDALSVNAIARMMGVSGPALYRYFDGRDALLSELIADAYNDLADALEAATSTVASRREDPLRVFASAYRDWALLQPQRYRLLFVRPVPGYEPPPQTVPAAHRSMLLLLNALQASQSTEEKVAPSRELDRQLKRWIESRGQRYPTGLLRRALTWWIRLHGAVRLEIDGNFAAMGLDAALIFEAEIDALID